MERRCYVLRINLNAKATEPKLDNISDESDVNERFEDTHGDYAPVDRKIHVPQLKSRNICTTVTDIGLGKEWITLVKEQIKSFFGPQQGPSTEPTLGPGTEQDQEVTKEVQSSSKQRGKKSRALGYIVQKNHVKYNKFISKQIPKLLNQLGVSLGSESKSDVFKKLFPIFIHIDATSNIQRRLQKM